MCRLVAYSGKRKTTIHSVLSAPPHSLRDQAMHPRELSPNVPSGDGWGMAWYTKKSPMPARYRSVLPMWRDPNLDSMTPFLRSSMFVAATRIASGESEIAVSNNQPFVNERFVFAHNGELEDFETTFLRPLRAELSPARESMLRGTTDSEHLFSLFLDAMDREPNMVEAARSVIDRVDAIARKLQRGATMNVVAADGVSFVALRFATAGKVPPSLYLRRNDEDVVVASEPFDDDAAWTAIAPRSVVFSASPTDVRELDAVLSSSK